MGTDTITATGLPHVLDGLAERIAARGTLSEAAALADLAAAARPYCPGAADALVDWEGAEVARLRAFGVVHGMLGRQIASGRHRAPMTLAA